MFNQFPNSVVRHLRRAVARKTEDGLDDAQLLGRFAANGDEAAFEVLVWRHGPMVLGVCRRILGRHHDAEDAMQATFLALARQAGFISRRAAVGPWLFQVATRTSLRIRMRSGKHRSVPLDVDPPAPALLDLVGLEELSKTVDEELLALPEKYRAPLIMTYFQGLTNDEVAQQLGRPLGTIATQLARGREQLRRRLLRRGVTSLGLLPMLLEVSGMPGFQLVRSTTSAASALVMGRVVSELLRPEVLALVEYVVTKPIFPGLRTAFAALVLLATMAGALFSTTKPTASNQSLAWVAPPIPRMDGDGEPLPGGAVLRLGSTHLRHQGLTAYVCLPDNKTVATAGGDGVIRFWSLATGKLVRSVSLQGNAAQGTRVNLALNAKTLVAANSGKLVFWDVPTGKELHRQNNSLAETASLCFSPDGETLAVGSWSMQVHFIRWRGGSEKTGETLVVRLPRRKIGMDSTFHIGYSPDGKYFAMGGGWNEPLYLLDAKSGKVVHRLGCYARASTFSPDSKQLLVCSMVNDQLAEETVFRTFDLVSGKEVKQIALGSKESYFRLAFSPNGKSLACGFSDQSLVLDPSTGKVRYALPSRPILLSFAADGKTLLGSTGQQLRLWDAESGKERLAHLPGFGRDPVVACSPDGQLIAEGDWVRQVIHIWDLRTGKLRHQLPLKGEGRYVRSLRFSDNGQTLMVAQAKGFWQFWDVATAKELRSDQLRDPLQALGLSFYDLQFSPDGKFISTLDRLFTTQGESTRVACWDVATGRMIAQHNPVLGGLRRCVWQNDGKVGALSVDDSVTLQEVTSGKVRVTVKGLARFPVRFSPDESLFVALREPSEKGKPGVLAVFDSASGGEVAKLDVGRVELMALAWDNRSVITAAEHQLSVWDLPSGRKRRSWKLPSPVQQMILLPGRSRLLTVLQDSTGLVWNIAPALARGDRLGKEPGEKELAGWWEELGSASPAKSYQALWRLSDVHGEALYSFLKPRLRPVLTTEFESARKYIKALDEETFAAREKASRELESRGRSVLAALREGLANKPSTEVRRRLEKLLARAEQLPSHPDERRRERAIKVLEQVDTTEAQNLLKQIAEGMPDATLTQLARAALRRRSHQVR